MSLQQIPDSIIAADIGTAWTRVLLIQRVEGGYRVTAAGEAPTTLAAPHADLAVGLRDAVRRLEIQSQRRLLDESGALITPEAQEWQGVDLLLLTVSALPPLRVAVGGLVSRVSVASARRAAHGTCSAITHEFSLDAHEGRWGTPRGVPGVVASLLANFPDAIILSGGAEGGNDHSLMELVEGVALAVGAAGAEPTLIFAGNSVLRESVRARLAPHSVDFSENLRPTPERERLRPATRLLDRRVRERAAALPGFEALQGWGVRPPVPAVEAFAHLVEYLAVRNEQSVLGVDMGAGATTLAASFADRVTQTAVRRDLGLASPSTTLAPEALAAWVGLDESNADLYNRWLNVTLAPAQAPADDASLSLLQGVARALLHAAVREAGELWPPAGEPPRFDVVLGAGRVLRDAPRPAQALSILLDGIQSGGITRFFRDRAGFGASVGALAETEPAIAAGLMGTQSFESLGSVITPLGAAHPGDEVVRFRVTQPEGRTEGVVRAGELFTVPTRQPTELFVQPARHMDIGFGEGVGATLSGEGDSVGFVIDGRGRPLMLPPSRADRLATLEAWNHYVGA